MSFRGFSGKKFFNLFFPCFSVDSVAKKQSLKLLAQGHPPGNPGTSVFLLMKDEVEIPVKLPVGHFQGHQAAAFEGIGQYHF